MSDQLSFPFETRRMMNRILCTVIVFLLHAAITAQTISPLAPLPTAVQQTWQDRGFYLFVHFGPNTFTDLEWGKGTEKEEIFNPAALDCRQWCRIAKAAGAKGIVITAKHHDGFCLWPSKYSTHTVAQSKWRDGKGDVLKELSEACRAEGIAFGVYLSPWDRNHPAYGTPAYNDVFVHMMEEVTARYGPFFEFWWDGANGEGPNGKKMDYDWHRFEQTMRRVAPQTPVFSDIGPDMRWVGNENGMVGKTDWALLDTAGFHRGIGAPPNDTLNQGNVNGKNWIPAESDVSIRPGWFYHKKEDSAVKTGAKLFDIYLKTVGRGSNLILNVPPDGRGLFTAYDSAALMEFARLRSESFSQSLLTLPGTTVAAGATRTDKEGLKSLVPGKDVKTAMTDSSAGTWAVIDTGGLQSLNFAFDKPRMVNCIRLEEPTAMGQRVSGFTLHILKGQKEIGQIEGTTIGHQRIISFPGREADAIAITFKGKTTVLICGAAVYKIDDALVEQ